MESIIQGGDIMKIEKIVELLDATTHYIPEGKEIDVTYGSASDLMSDVLAYLEGGNKTILITGLLTTQVIRTATLMEMSVVVFTRGKIPNEQIIEAAKKNDIAILSTRMTKYATCGILYSAGLESVDGYTFSGDDKDSGR
jgi:hypothetical protein